MQVWFAEYKYANYSRPIVVHSNSKSYSSAAVTVSRVYAGYNNVPFE